MSITSADIKSFLEIDSIDDSVVVSVLNGVMAFVEQYTGKKLTADSADVTEYYNGDGTQILFMTKYPINSISEISYNTGTRTSPIWTIVNADYYFADLEKGEVVFQYMQIPRGFGNIRIKSRRGYTTLPADLELAVKLLCGNMLNRKDSQGIAREDVQGTILVYSVTDKMTPEIKQLLDPYISFNV